MPGKVQSTAHEWIIILPLVLKMSSACFVLFTFGVLAAFSTVQCQNFKTFMNKHIIDDQENINCNITIQNRKLNRDSCRFHNTFIHDSEARKMRSMCSPHQASQVVSSSAALKLTDCKLLKTPSSTTCSYSQSQLTGIVHVTCENYVPVHFVKFQLSQNSSPSWAPCVWKLLLLLLLKELLA